MIAIGIRPSGGVYIILRAAPGERPSLQEFAHRQGLGQRGAPQADNLRDCLAIVAGADSDVMHPRAETDAMFIATQTIRTRDTRLREPQGTRRANLLRTLAVTRERNQWITNLPARFPMPSGHRLSTRQGAEA